MKQKRLPLFLLAILAFSMMMCTLPGLDGEEETDPDLTATIAAIQMTQTSLALAPTSTPTIVPPEIPTPTSTIAPVESPEVLVGSISGQLSYPSEGIPQLRVVAFNINSGFYYYIETAQNQSAYIIHDLPVGIYHVVAYVLDGSFAGGYSQAVPCGLAVGCDDHSLINVEVTANQDSSDINPADWYAPAGSFPPMPAS